MAEITERYHFLYELSKNTQELYDKVYSSVFSEMADEFIKGLNL